jgi:signal transduction histidine kinase/ABC-type branched-subunit amino acid transport system ATPase component
MTDVRLGVPALRVRGLHKRFGSRRVLRGVELELRAGEILALVGENGAGKSTIVRCIARTDGAEAGTMELGGVALASDAISVRDQGLTVVWQDLALCDNLSAVANVFLGNERLDGLLLNEATMVAETQALFERLSIDIPQPLLPVGILSGGQRQLVAIARAVLRSPAVLVLDEPTASLGVTETQVVERLQAQLRASGTAILLVSHRLEQVFKLADRIAVLRDGRVVATVSPLEVHPDDVVAMISGVEADSTARRQLRRLRSLVDQLAEVEPSASLPLIVSAMAEALGIQQLCVHLLDQPDDEGRVRLRRSAAVGLRGPFLDHLGLLPIGPSGGPPGIAASTGEVVVVEDVSRDRRWRSGPPSAPGPTGPPRAPGAPGPTSPTSPTSPLGPPGPTSPSDDDSPTGADPGSAPRSSWSVPILGSFAVIGTISGYADTVGRPQADQLELVSLYAGHAAAAIERERLLGDATRRNRVLETLREVLDTLAGPQPAQGGLSVALLALCRGLGADAIVFRTATGAPTSIVLSALDGDQQSTASEHQRLAAAAIVAEPGLIERARLVGPDVLAVPIEAPDGRAVLTAWWADPTRSSDDAVDLLHDAARSLRLALERQAVERANAEAASLRRSQTRQREFLFRLNHELRTPLTAIQGFASTLRQPDVDWDLASQQRFLDSIASESARMGRLVGDLLDFSAIDSGDLRLQPDWCDLALVLEAARRCVTEAPSSIFELSSAELPSIWADHDRLEQVFVNLLENAVRHASGLTRVIVTARLSSSAAEVEIRVADDGGGIGWDPAERERVFRPHERGRTDGPGAGLGLAIARGIVEAHGGTIDLEPVAVGTSVLVTIPVEAAAEPVIEHLPTPAPAADHDQALPPVPEPAAVRFR